MLSHLAGNWKKYAAVVVVAAGAVAKFYGVPQPVLDAAGSIVHYFGF